jgi:diaminobutyrate-2-oxoglutarate transaminase
MQTFEDLESEVRVYSRSFPTVFVSSSGYQLFDEQGRAYIDFFSGAGALNYGHNPPRMRERLIEYLQADGVLHSLDMATAAKRAFLQGFEKTILRPRGLRYKVQFTGPTGANAVEAALKLARKASGRKTVLFFDNAYHGLSLGALSVTANPTKRAAAGVPLPYTTPFPFEGHPSGGDDSLQNLASSLARTEGSVDHPAAIILETVQAEGGINVASFDWLRALADLARRHGVLLIVDEIQVGCGRTGTFFSFEPAGITPDLVCLSKSISGNGLPMALVLLRPELDVWAPGEHTGTFRGNNLAFVAATEALTYWENGDFAGEVARKGDLARSLLQEIVDRHPEIGGQVRGRGLIQGLRCEPEGLAQAIARAAFGRGLVIETAGPRDTVLKLLPPLTIDDAGLAAGIARIADSIPDALEAVRRPALALSATAAALA